MFTKKNDEVIDKCANAVDKATIKFNLQVGNDYEIEVQKIRPRMKIFGIEIDMEKNECKLTSIKTTFFINENHVKLYMCFSQKIKQIVQSLNYQLIYM